MSENTKRNIGRETDTQSNRNKHRVVLERKARREKDRRKGTKGLERREQSKQREKFKKRKSLPLSCLCKIPETLIRQ